MPKKVLIAEDDPSDAFLLRRAFAAAGVPATLHFVRDGQEAIDYLGGEAAYADRNAHPLPDLMLLDTRMPGLAGWKILKWVRERPGLRHLPVIVFTGSGDPGDKKMAEALDAAYEIKPQSFNELVQVVRKMGGFWLHEVPARRNAGQRQ